MGGFDTLAMANRYFGNGNIAALNSKLHESTAYNVFQTGVTALAIFTGGMATTMKCFVAGTMILTAEGLYAIENIKKGDMVIATDPETGLTAPKVVLETYIRKTSHLVHLTVCGETIVSTFDHPYFVKDKGFVNACDLWIGAELVDNNGVVHPVEQIYREEVGEFSIEVYNFNVEEYHTYFVGNACIFVHNSECGGSFGSLKKDKEGKMHENEEVHHMPAKKSSKLSTNDGPAIRMERSDHRQTANSGRSKSAQQYRAKQESLINQGRFREAVNMDINDIHSKFGGKYDQGIKELLNYVDELEGINKI